jgi:uncharacterized phiE125 gp8 family phage protein
MRRVNAIISALATSPSTAPALDLDLVKLQRRVGSSTALDALFEMWIAAATSHFQEQTGRQVIIAPFEYRLDCPPPCDRFIEIPRAPLVSVDGITFASDGSPSVDTFGADNYDVITPTGDHAAPGRIVLKSGASWPTVSAVDGALRIAFSAGYADSAVGVPKLIQAALMFLVGHFHKYGEEVIGGPEANSLQKIPLGASAMIEAFKYTALPTQALWEVPWQG